MGLIIPPIILTSDRFEAKDHPKVAAGVAYLKMLEWHVEDKCPPHPSISQPEPRDGGAK